MKYYDESVLLKLSFLVEKSIKVDTRIVDAIRGWFTQVCVEINLDQPMIGKVWLRNH